MKKTTFVVVTLCAAKLLLHIFTSLRNYGYFRDELYYLDMARHLDWGYVDAAPLIAVYTKFAMLMGGSLAALRILPAVAGAVLIALSIYIARELGGGTFAQFLTGLCLLLSPAVLAVDSLLTMNAFEPLYWMGCMLIVARILRTGNSRLWIWFGVLAGLALENKHSAVFFGFSVTVALLLTGHRREFAKPWIWIAAAIAFAIFLPNLIWQWQHHFPTIEDLQNVRREGKNVVFGPVEFVKQQIITQHPVLMLVWLTGVVALLRSRIFRVLGLTFLVFFVLMEVAHAKVYYVFPIYPMLFAAGAVALESFRYRTALVALIVILCLPFVPLATWMLSPPDYIAYERFLHFEPAKAEVRHAGPLPQPIGDQFGWPEMAREVGQIFNSLPPAERATTGIYAGNYGEAGAINLWGPQYGLPRAYSRHQNYWFWGPPPIRWTNAIILQSTRENAQRRCASYTAYPHFQPYGMAEENTPIYLCRGLNVDIRKIWPEEHHWN